MKNNMLSDKAILFGPYVGNLKEELISFLPFVNWFKEFFNCKQIFISTHYTSKFLYSDVVYPVLELYSNDIKGQKGHTHKKLNSTDYQILKKYIIEKICNDYGYKKSDVVSYDLGYTTQSNIVNTQKIFKKMDKPIYENGKILILSQDHRQKQTEVILKFLKNNYNNIKYLDCTIECPEKMIDEVLSSSLVVTPSSHWTLLCNIHKKKVFSWGRDISLYKDTLNFDNDSCYLYRIDGKITNGLYSHLCDIIKKLED